MKKFYKTIGFSYVSCFRIIIFTKLLLFKKKTIKWFDALASLNGKEAGYYNYFSKTVRWQML